MKGEWMGNVKSTQIKTLSDGLLEIHPDKFSTNFEENKKVIDELLSLESKSQRNKIAGFITHTLKKMQRLKTVKISYQNPNLDKKKKKKRF